MTDRRPAAAAVLAAAVLWGTVGTAQELGVPDAAPASVAAARSLVGGVLLVAVVGATRGAGVLAPFLRGRRALATLGSAVAITVFQVAYLTGIRLAGVAVGTLLGIGSAPVWAGLLAAARGRRPRRSWVAGTLTTLAGTVLLVLPSGGATAVSLVGVAAALLAGAAYGTYTTVSVGVVRGQVDGSAAMAVVFVTCGLLLAPVLVVADLSWVLDPRGLGTLLWLAFATTALAYVLFARGLRRIDAPSATTLTLAEPLTATLLALVVVGERLAPTGLVGAALLVVGLLVVSTPRSPGTSVRTGRTPRRGH